MTEKEFQNITDIANNFMKGLTAEIKKLNDTVAGNAKDIAVIQMRCVERGEANGDRKISIGDLYDKYDSLNGKVMKLLGGMGVALAILQVVLRYLPIGK